MIRAVSSTAFEPEIRSFSTEEYHRLGELGFFEDEHVELIEGVIYSISPQNAPHVVACTLVDRAMSRLENQDRYLLSRKPIPCRNKSEPEPDACIVKGILRNYSLDRPLEVLLIVEIAITSLPFDRAKKLKLYASEGVEEYWILNLHDRILEVHRKPNCKLSESGEANYGERFVVAATESVSPLIDPSQSFAVADLLP